MHGGRLDGLEEHQTQNSEGEVERTKIYTEGIDQEMKSFFGYAFMLDTERMVKLKLLEEKNQIWWPHLLSKHHFLQSRNAFGHR